MSQTTNTDSGTPGRFAEDALGKVIATKPVVPANGLDGTATFCINRRGDLIDAQSSKPASILSNLWDGVWIILSPAHIVIMLVVFVADLWVSIPVRLLIGSFILYQQITASQQLEGARLRFESAYVETVHDDLKDNRSNRSLSACDAENHYSEQGSAAAQALSGRDNSQQSSSLTAAHRAGMKTMDCNIDVLSTKLSSPEPHKDGLGTVINMTFHMKVTHRPTETKWHIWRQYSDFIYIRHAMSLEFMADHNTDVISASRHPSASSIDDGDANSTNGGSGHKTNIVSRLLTKQGSNAHKFLSGVNGGGSVNITASSGGNTLGAELPSLPLPLTSPANVPPLSVEYLALITKRREVQVLGWLLQMQELPPFANHPFFREFLGMPEYDASIIIPTNNNSGSGESSGSSSALTVVPKNFTGTCLDDFKFLDINPAFKYMFKSCRETHGIPARGRTYMTDKKKINPGRAICELILMEVYEIPARDKADRADHIAMRGQVKRRLEALKTLTDNPFIFLLNFQIPGDPPVSIVSYYALPSDYLERNKDMENIKGFGSLVDRFVDVPRTEDERLAAWGLGPLAGKPPRPTPVNGSNGITTNSAVPAASSASDNISTDDNKTTAKSNPRPSISATTPTRMQDEHGTGTADILSSDDEDGCIAVDKKKYKLYDCFPADHHGVKKTAAPGVKKTATDFSGDLDNALLMKKTSGGKDKDIDNKDTPAKPKHKSLWGMFSSSHLGHMTATATGSSTDSRHQQTPAGSTVPMIQTSDHKMDKDTSGTWRESGGVTAPASPTATTDTTITANDDPTLVPASSAASNDHVNGSAPVGSAPVVSAPVGSAPVLSAPASSAAVISKTKSSWNMSVPSDITWPDPENPDAGTLPQSDFRNQRFKLIPLMLEGPWVVLAAVKSQPALLGRKVVQRYFRGDNYMEIDVYVGSSIIASQIVGICRGYAKHFTCNIGIMIQGESEDELPERMLAVLTQNKVDLDLRIMLED